MEFGVSLVLFLLYLPLVLFSRTLWCLAFRSSCFCSIYRLYCFLVPFGVWPFARLVFALITACIVFSYPLVFGFLLVLVLLYLPLVLFSRTLWCLAFRSSWFCSIYCLYCFLVPFGVWPFARLVLLYLPLVLFSPNLWCLAFRLSCFCSIYCLYCFLVPYVVWRFARLVFALFTACIVFSYPSVFGFSLVLFFCLPLILFSRAL